MSYTDHSVQRRLKSNAPNGRKPRPILELPPRLEFPPPFGDLQAAVIPFSAHAPGPKLTSGLCLYIGLVSGAG